MWIHITDKLGLRVTTRPRISLTSRPVSNSDSDSGSVLASHSQSSTSSRMCRTQVGD